MSLLTHPSKRVATGVLLFSASLWGLSWMPLKWFIAQGLTGPMVSLLSYGVVGLFTCVFIWRQRAAWRAQWGMLLALAVVGGWANTSFVNALMLGDVVRVMFLFYLSPVWSVLGGWLFLKERIPPLRWAAVVVALLRPASSTPSTGVRLTPSLSRSIEAMPTSPRLRISPASTTPSWSLSCQTLNSANFASVASNTPSPSESKSK